MIVVILATIIFIAAYVLIVWDKIDRMVVAMCGGALMVLLGVFTQQHAVAEIDFNTIGLLVGMMIIVMITKRTGVFEYLAIRTVKAAKGEPIRILILLSLITGLLSALLDNVTTVLLILPVTLSIAKDLHINPIPYVISEIFASNVGGTATLIGDPPNIMIGSAVGLSFMDFLQNVAVISFVMLVMSVYVLAWIYKKKLVTTDEAKKMVMDRDERKAIKDQKLLVKSLAVLGVVMIGFLLHSVLHYESATIAMVGAVFLLLISGIKPEKIFHEVEWGTIFFFVGLFIMVGGIKETGLIGLLAEKVMALTEGNLVLTSLAVLWVSAIASAFVDNIPFVATMIPMIQDMGTMSGMNLNPLWWSLSLGACLGGNGTVIGASANVVALGIAQDHGHRITFGQYFKIAFPLMLLTIGVSTVYMWVFYLL